MSMTRDTPSRAPRLRPQQPVLERRRLAAAELFAQGLTAAAVALRLGVSRQSAHRWYRAWLAGGTEALRVRGPVGRRRKLSAAQLGQVEQALLRGASAHGFAGNLWTLDRVTKVIWRLTGVRHHPVQVWRILTQRLGWSLQRPRRMATERDQAAIDQWLAEEWPRIKRGARRRGAWVVFLDESGVSLTPVVRRTWAPIGQSPVLVHPFHWQRASMAAAICAKVGGGGARVAFDIRPGSYNTERLIEVLGELHRFLDGDKVTLVWDNLSAHTSRAMRTWIRSQRSWLVVEYLPPYAPDLNPVETLWTNLKRQELANLATDRLGEVITAAHRGIQRIRATWWLPYAFARRCGLYFW